MEVDKDLIEKISRIIIVWNQTRKTKRLFGPYHLYTKKAFKEFLDALESIFSFIKRISIIKERHDLIIFIEDVIIEGKALQPMSIFGSILSIKEDFERLNISDITFLQGVSKLEIGKLFDGLSKSNFSLGSSGVKGYLESEGVEHIKINSLDSNVVKAIVERNFDSDEDMSERIRRISNLSA